MIQTVELDESAWERVEYCVAYKGSHAIVARIRAQRIRQDSDPRNSSMDYKPPAKTVDAASKFMTDVTELKKQLDRMEETLNRIEERLGGSRDGVPFVDTSLVVWHDLQPSDLPGVETKEPVVTWNQCQYCDSEMKHLGSFGCPECGKFNLIRRK